MNAAAPTMKGDLQREAELFRAAGRLVGPARASFLDGACHGDPALLQRLNTLLAAHEQDDGVLAETAEATPATMKIKLWPVHRVRLTNFKRPFAGFARLGMALPLASDSQRLAVLLLSGSDRNQFAGGFPRWQIVGRDGSWAGRRFLVGRAQRRELTRLAEAERNVRAVLSPTGPLLAFIGTSATIEQPSFLHLWNTATQKMIAERPLDGGCAGIAISRDVSARRLLGIR